MFKKIIRTKLRSLFVFVLIASMLSQSVMPVYAGGNTGSESTAPYGALSSKRYFTSLHNNLAVFLYAGDIGEFVMDRDELKGKINSGSAKYSYRDDAYVAKFKAQYPNMSITKGYAQIFKRTMVSWNAPGAKESLMLMGPDMWWDGSGPGGGITYDALGSVMPDSFFDAHKMNYDPEGKRRKLYTEVLDTSWPTYWTAPNGNGVFKAKIDEYVRKWCSDLTDVPPNVFFNDLVSKATATERRDSYRVWAYISAGPEAAADGILTESPSMRLSKVFDKHDALNPDTTFIGAPDTNNQPYTLSGTTKVPLKDWRLEPKVVDQVAAYLDILVTLNVVAGLNNKPDVGKPYLKAATSIFGTDGKYTREFGLLEQTKSVVFDNWTSQTYANVGQASKGTAVAYTDNWGVYRRLYATGAPRTDFRVGNTGGMLYNDYSEYPMAADSPVLQKWKKEVPESVDRIGIRLSLLNQSLYPAKDLIGDSNLDIVKGSIWYPGRTAYGVTSSSLGRYVWNPVMDTISAGLKGVQPKYMGLDSQQLGMVGGQFVVYMFSHATNTTTGFTQSISAAQDNTSVVPNASNTLGQQIKVTHKVGTAWATPAGSTKAEASYNSKTLTDFLNTYAGFKADPALKAVIKARTALTKKVTKYQLNTLWVGGAPGNLTKASVGAPDTVATDVPQLTTKLGISTVPMSNMATQNLGWQLVTEAKLKEMMQNNSVMYDFYDDSYKSKPWTTLPQPKTFSTPSAKYVYTPGADYILEVTYTANTEFKIVDGSDTPLVYNKYLTGVGSSLAPFPDKSKVGAYLCASNSMIATQYNSVSDTASYVYKLKETLKTTPILANQLSKSPLQYAVYSSSPEAYAELKNWGVASTNEPQDGTYEGDGRSPVDTQLGVSSSTKSNGSSVINEDYEAMAGVPTTEKLYLAVGGSEFIVDLAVQYVPNETAIRSYTSRFDGVASQFNYASATGAGGDTAGSPVWANIPQSTAGASVSGVWDHTGGTITYTMSGAIDAAGSSAVVSESKTGNGATTHSGTPWSMAVGTTASANGGSSNSASASISAKVAVTPNATDVAKFNQVMTDAEAWAKSMTTWINGIEFTSGSDKVSRKIPNSPGGAWTFTKTVLPGTQAASGSLAITDAPNFGLVSNDGTETSFDVVTFTSTGMSVTNPRDLAASASNSQSNAFYSNGGTPPAPPSDHFSGTTSGSGSDSQSKPTWSITLTFTLKPHALCGPECGHNLPAIQDTWQQSFNYDYLKIIGLNVMRLDQGSAADIALDGSGLSALIGTAKLGVTRQTYYSSPTMNLAQANIFNYMGLQTDGTKDVNSATNEYFRSIAYGVGTTWGNTRSSEANRVRYWMLNADGSTLTNKGTTFQRLTYTGNTPSSAPFSNELVSAWGAGAVKAGDQVTYNFGNRSNLSDGTSRGYQYNVNKSSWVEKVGGSWRGKAAYELPWAKGFLYDGVRADGSVDASGFSISRYYRNSADGVIQSGTKGWQGVGMTTTTQNYKTNSYTGNNGVFAWGYAEGVKPTATTLRTPAIRDWGTSLHNVAYSDTINAVNPKGAVLPWAAGGDVAPTTAVAKLWADGPGKNTTNDTLAQSQPYAVDSMLTAYTNTANDGGAIIRNTNEYKLMLAKRNERVQATVISDSLVLDLPNGLQPIVYHYKNAAVTASAADRLPDTRVTYTELWKGNMFTPNNWVSSATGTAKDGIITGGYNGDLSAPRVTGVNDVQKRLQWSADAIPATSNMFIQTKDASIEGPSGVVGKQLGAKVLNGTNINLYMAHNTTAPTRILSLPVTNRASVGAPVQRTLLYNVTPILLSAKNMEYNTGSAEAFWETLVQWKDSSNHDYYGKFVEAGSPAVPYLGAGQYIRLPALQGNYGQVAYDPLTHTYANGEQLLETYFKYTDSSGTEAEALGAPQSRQAQAEQYSRGFSVLGYNYDTTNTAAVAGAYNRNMYNASSDLTGAAKGNAYGTDGSLGVPFILDGVSAAGFSTVSAVRSVGSFRAGLPKSGYIQKAAYTAKEASEDRYVLNNVVVHNVISAQSTQIMPIAAWRDQRVYGQSLVSALRLDGKKGCPGTAELCEFSYLDDKYDKPLELLKLNLIGTGNSVPNTALNAATTGNIILAGSYALSGTGLSSNGSARTGVSLTDLGGPYYKALDYQVTAPITYSANTGEQMLFGFEAYGITLNTATKKLAIRLGRATSYVDVAGVFNSGDVLQVAFGSENATLSKVWVNGALRTLTIAGGGTFETLAVGKGDVGDSFYIGAWNYTAVPYLPTSATKYQAVLLERLAGGTAHTLACANTTVRHVGGDNTHVHTVECLGESGDTGYLNGTLLDWNNFVIDDATLRARLGDTVYNALNPPSKLSTTSITDGNVTIAPPPVSVGSQAFSYTGGVQTFTAPAAGSYTFELWGAQGGDYSYAGGLGGYSKGTYTLSAGQTIYLYVGGQGGWNGGGPGTSGYSAQGGGGTDIRVSGQALGNRVIVAGGGGGGAQHSGGGYGGGVTGGGSQNATGGTQSSGGISTYGSGNGTLGSGGSGAGWHDGGGGGGGYYGGGGGGNEPEHCYFYGGSGGSGYIGGVTSGTMSAGVRAGNGYANISWSISSGGTPVNFGFTGGTQTYTAPHAGVYTLETWGAQGGRSVYVGSGGLGGYSKGSVSLSAGQTIYVVVGGEGKYTASAPSSYQWYNSVHGQTLWYPSSTGYEYDYCVNHASYYTGVTSGGSSGASAGGYNGGGSVPNGTHQGGSGGGATHIATASGTLSALSGNKPSILLVAGGGGGSGDTLGGSGGGASGLAGTPLGGYNGYANGGTQTAGGTAWGDYGIATPGTFGLGGTAAETCSGGGGGGWYGGAGAYPVGGGGGSGYIGGVTGGITSNGVRSGAGYATITPPPVAQTKIYTFTVSGRPQKFDALVNKVSGSNPEMRLYSGGSAVPANLLQTVVGNPTASITDLWLNPGTYTIVVEDKTATGLTTYLRATLSYKNLTYADVMALPNISGAEAWRQIPYLLDNGSRNPVYSCNGELNAHTESPKNSQTLSYTGGIQSFTAPVTGTYTLEVWGAQGGGSASGMTGAVYNVASGSWVAGGLGGYSSGTVSLTAGQTISVYVGGAGENGAEITSTADGTRTSGGWNGGGAGGAAYQQGAGGGGATDIRIGGTDLASRKIVAGGGGGTSNWYNTVAGGAGGGTTGGNGVLNTGSVVHPLATGGTQTAGGVAGGAAPGQAGTLGQGGNSEYSHGGGGGGGYYGGGGGGVISSGVSSAGGGSGFIGGVSAGTMTAGVRVGDGKAVITWSEPSLCYTDIDYTKCTEPHHTGGHYEGDPLCYSPCLDDSKHDTNLVQNSKVNTPAGEFVSIDWDYTLYADSLSNLRAGTTYQVPATSNQTGLGYYDTNVNGDFDDVRFVRGKYVKFPWAALYDGVLYRPGEWVVLGDRGDYAQANVSVANKATGFGGNVQGGTAGDLWHGEQAASYNVQNWSLYNQPIYRDLYKDFYDFYLPVVNDEVNMGEVIYAKVAVNADDFRADVEYAGIPGTLLALGDLNDWLAGGVVSNRMRTPDNVAEVGAAKKFVVDAVGRVGGLVIQDTTDVKFSNTFKQALAPVAETTTVYDIDLADLSGLKPGRLTKALQVASGIVTEGRLLAASGSIPTRATFAKAQDWVGFDYTGGNARKYILTVTGSNLSAGELTVAVEDASNGLYTLRVSDMLVLSNTGTTLKLECNVKQTNATVTLRPKFSMLDTSEAMYVSSMSVAIGGSGFDQGLNKAVDQTRQNRYVTDITDVRGVYLGAASNTSAAVEGFGTLAWGRYASYNDVSNWIRISDSTQVRDANHISQRTTPAYGTRAIDTYGTRPWVKETDPLYKALASTGGRALIGPLTSASNVVPQYRTPEDQLSVGSEVFYDITTIGNYNDLDSTLKIIPTYYMVDTTKRDANGAVALIPVDVYQFSSSGNYQPVNIFGAPYGGFTNVQLDTFNQYRLNVNWDEEAKADKNRRMVTQEEMQAVQTYSDLFRDYTYAGDPYATPGFDIDDPSTYPEPTGYTASPRKVPSGVMEIGGAQFIQQNYQTQTFIGSNFTYGVDKSGDRFAAVASNPTQSGKYIYWQAPVQRWHTTLGLPSDAMFVPLAQDPVTNKFIHRPVSDIQANAVDITKTLIIGYIDAYAEGSIWTLHYGNQGLQRKLNLNGVDYLLPIAGPAGPAMANPYTGQTSVGTDYTNGGIPFVVFGGSRVRGQADVIKVN